MSSIAARRANKRACPLQPNGILFRGTHVYPGANAHPPRAPPCAHPHGAALARRAHPWPRGRPRGLCLALRALAASPVAPPPSRLQPSCRGLHLPAGKSARAEAPQRGPRLREGLGVVTRASCLPPASPGWQLPPERAMLLAMHTPRHMEALCSARMKWILSWQSSTPGRWWCMGVTCGALWGLMGRQGRCLWPESRLDAPRRRTSSRPTLPRAGA